CFAFVQLARLLSFRRGESTLGSWAFRANLIRPDESESLSIHRAFHWRGADLSTDPARASVSVASVFAAAETGCGKKRDLRVRGRVDWRCANSIPIAVLSLRDHFSDL